MAMCNYDMIRHSQSKDTYPVTKQSQSNRIALLINNMNFYDQRLTRHGAQKDEEAMARMLHILGYDVERWRNLTAQKMDQALKRFSRHPKLVLTDSVFVVLMSHGGMRTMLGIDNQKLEINRIYEHLSKNSCPALKDKPKIIIIQASNGVCVQGRRMQEMDLTAFPPLSPDAQLHMEQDFISLHCLAPHIIGYRHMLVNSFFIQNIIGVFNDHKFKDHIDEIFKRITACFHLAGVEKLMPIIERCTLMNYFYLFPGNQQLSAGQERLSGKAACLRVGPAGVRWERTELMKHSCQPVIDINTVNRKLKMCNNRKKVVYAMAVQSYPHHPDRFDRPQLLCKHGVTARSYWEVQWNGEVYIAVSYKGITRKGEGNETLFGWNNQSWSLYCSDKYSVWHDSKETALPSSFNHSCKVGVYVDCHAGTLSFFSVSSNTLTHLHTFQTKFTEPVYPGFRVFTASTLHL